MNYAQSVDKNVESYAVAAPRKQEDFTWLREKALTAALHHNFSNPEDTLRAAKGYFDWMRGEQQ